MGVSWRALWGLDILCRRIIVLHKSIIILIVRSLLFNLNELLPSVLGTLQ